MFEKSLSSYLPPKANRESHIAEIFHLGTSVVLTSSGEWNHSRPGGAPGRFGCGKVLPGAPSVAWAVGRVEIAGMVNVDVKEMI